VLPDSPAVQEAREFWASLGPEADAQAKKARLAAVAVSKPSAKFETEDDTEEEAVVENLVRDENVEEYWEHDEELEEERVNGNRWKEIDKLVELEAFEVVPADKAAGQLVLNTRFVDTKDKSRFVAKEIRTYATDEFYAPASTPTTGRLVDSWAIKKQLSRLALDVGRAFLHVPEDEIVFAKPPPCWLEKEAAEGRSTHVLWRMRKVLYGRRKAGQAWVNYLTDLLCKFGLERSASAPRLLKLHEGSIFVGGSHR